jgi:hypothetical protein
MKKIVLGTLLLGTNLLFSSTLEYYQLYKDIHIMKMGGANIALGGSGTAIFYNPAGLATMKKRDGVELRLLNIALSTNDNVINLGKDGLDIADIEDEDERNLEVIRLAREHLGENNHFEVSNFSYIAKNIKNFNFSLGALTNLNLDFRTHRGFGSNGFFDIQGLILGGGAFGISYSYSDNLSLGLGTKFLKYLSVNKSFTIGELITYKDDIQNYLIDEVAKDGEDLVFDFGAIYKLKNNLQIGFSALNLGGIGEKNHITYIPETYNLGLGYTEYFQHKFLKEVKIGLDYIDLTENYVESDFMKKVRTGFEATMIDNNFLTLKGGLGIYQGYYTAGIDLRLTVVHLSFMTYAEEIGAYSGQDEDRRFIFNIGIGW